ncbi:hypothetical protein LOCC1_G004376 [Lachnellula occidentalis]|uniref:Uncharacterized protein n=1 Tax=Lachnellula occidentalis TaxID=215460 RepID=A0A8H8RXK1_9HELO|nr:hypothetical protein LOCC1_G004376 [Lachnellula occidentalis]
MTSEFPAASSSQQAFASPQPAPVTPAHQAASPPPENLKSWWARFRKDRPKHETQGNYFHDPSFESRHLNTNFGERSVEFLSPQSRSFVVRPSSPTSSIPDTL